MIQLKSLVLTLTAGALLGLGLTALAQSAPQEGRQEQGGRAEEAAAEAAPTQAELDAATVKAQKPSYPLATCLISGEELGSMGEPIELVLEGRLIRLCCKGCVDKAKADPAAAIAKIDAAVIAAQATNYALKTCPVSGEELGSMGDPVNVVVGTRLVKVCCDGCVKRVKSDPAAALAKVDAALIEALRPNYGIATCFVSSEAIDDAEAVEFLYGTDLVRLCCKGCKREFDKDPEAAMANLKAAREAATTKQAPQVERPIEQPVGGRK